MPVIHRVPWDLAYREVCLVELLPLRFDLKLTSFFGGRPFGNRSGNKSAQSSNDPCNFFLVATGALLHILFLVSVIGGAFQISPLSFMVCCFIFWVIPCFCITVGCTIAKYIGSHVSEISAFAWTK